MALPKPRAFAAIAALPMAALSVALLTIGVGPALADRIKHPTAVFAG
ncbi:MAG: hypothetical protein JO004_03125, partial [Methylobacteriaceae bacterium]|nr:hypothetical protein [Methylobacteriaceae bacterium]